MKFSNKLNILKLDKKSTSKYKRVYYNQVYTITVIVDSFGDCAGEGKQFIKGKLLIKSKSGVKAVKFEGADANYSSKECAEMGNG